MNQPDQISALPRGRFAALIYHLIILLLLPVTVIGYVVWVAKALWVGRRSGVSGTAQGPLSARWFQHQIGTRRDEASSRLLMVLPGISPLAVWLVFGPMRFAHRMSGYVPKAFQYPFEGDIPIQLEAAARQTFFDAVVDQYILKVEQFVSLGAGFDTRAYRLPKDAAVRAFEVDAPKTQAIKREMVKKAGIDTGSAVFVSADFEQEDWYERLAASGFDKNKPALFLMEGVVMYLERDAAIETFRKIAGSAKGSMVSFDYMTTEPLESRALYLRYARAATKASGEPFKFGVDSTPPSRDRLAELLQSCGLTLLEHRTIGDERDGKRAFGGFAVAGVKETK